MENARHGVKLLEGSTEHKMTKDEFLAFITQHPEVTTMLAEMAKVPEGDEDKTQADAEKPDKKGEAPEDMKNPAEDMKNPAEDKKDPAEDKKENPEDGAEGADGEDAENGENKPTEAEKKTEDEAPENQANEPEKTENGELEALRAKYNDLLIKDAIINSSYGFTKAQVPFIARLIDTEGLVANDTVDTDALGKQLEAISAAFPAVTAEAQKPVFRAGAPEGTDETGKSFLDKMREAAGL